MNREIIDVQTELAGPLGVGVDGRLYRDPLVFEKAVGKKRLGPLNVEGRDPRELMHVMGYTFQKGVEYIGAFPIAELAEAIQGYHNIGHDYIFVQSTGKIGTTDWVLAEDIKERRAA